MYLSWWGLLVIYVYRSIGFHYARPTGFIIISHFNEGASDRATRSPRVTLYRETVQRLLPDGLQRQWLEYQAACTNRIFSLARLAGITSTLFTGIELKQPIRKDWDARSTSQHSGSIALCAYLEVGMLKVCSGECRLTWRKLIWGMHVCRFNISQSHCFVATVLQRVFLFCYCTLYHMQVMTLIGGWLSTGLKALGAPQLHVNAALPIFVISWVAYSDVYNQQTS